MWRISKTAGFLLLALLAATPAVAQPLSEWLGAAANGGSRAEFGTPGLPPLPADFFGPGSDPFEGQVTFGRADSYLPALENVIRLDFPEPPMSPADPPGSNRTIPAELVEMSLLAVQPIEVTYAGGAASEAWRVAMTLSVSPAPAGQAFVLKEHENGGVFDSVLFVQPRFTFTRVSDDMTLVHDTGLEGLAPLQLTGPGHFVHVADPLLRLRAEHDGLTVLGVEELVWGDPSSQCPDLTHLADPDGALVLELAPLDVEIIVDGWCLDPGTEPDCSYVEFGPASNPPLPADFFGPGSDPFVGQVCLWGDPLGLTDWGEFGTADLLFRRSADPFDRCSLPEKADEVTSVNVVGYKKVKLPDPFKLSIGFNGGGTVEPWNMRMTLDPAGSLTGSLDPTKIHENGGTFDLEFAYYPRFIFTRESDGYEIVLDASLAGRPPLEFTAAAVPWVHQADPALELLAPGQGRFVPGVSETIPGDPGSQVESPLVCDEISGAAHLVYLPVHGDASGVDLPPVPQVELSVHPNPFNPVTSFAFELRREGPVTLRIHDLRGRAVRTLVHEVLGAGEHEFVWRARDDAGRRVASGIYAGVLQTREGIRTCKLALIK